jgi:hypothetical protein
MSLIEKLEKDNLLERSLFSDDYNFLDNKVRQLSSFLIKQFRPQISELNNDITMLNGPIQFANSQVDVATLRRLKEDYLKLNTDFKKLFNDFLDKILDSAETDNKFPSEINKKFERLIKPQLSTLSKNANELRKLLAKEHLS